MIVIGNVHIVAAKRFGQKEGVNAAARIAQSFSKLHLPDYIENWRPI